MQTLKISGNYVCFKIQPLQCHLCKASDTDTPFAHLLTSPSSSTQLYSNRLLSYRLQICLLLSLLDDIFFEGMECVLIIFVSIVPGT